MDGMVTTGTVLVAVFAVFLAALLAELTYVLWRRWRFRRLSRAGADDARAPSSKELLHYFPCFKNQSRVEPFAPAHATGILSETAEGDVVAAKWQMGLMYRHSRELFTIKEEEEREESAADNASANGDHHRLHQAVVVDFDGGDVSDCREATPCTSTPYCTPSAFPDRDGVCSPEIS